MRILLLMTLFTALLCSNVSANNIVVNNVRLVGQDISASTNNAANFTTVQFDLSWENSWRTSSAPNNWDAAWVFVKFRVGNGPWQHALLNNTGHTAPSGSTIDIGLLDPRSAFDATSNPGLGAFIYRSADGNGTFSASGVRLRWNYGRNVVEDDASLDVQVFAIEMVYVPQGSFWVGTGGSDTDAFYTSPSNSNPYQISSEDAITVGTAAGDLYYESTFGASGDRAGPIPAAFPKGFDAFYCMKYEITQQQYVDFLNTLTRVQQNARTFTDLAIGVTNITRIYVMGFSTSVNLTFRNGIRCDADIDANDPITFYCDLNGNGIGGESDDGQWIGCNWLNFMSVAAYLDWSGLRPMTELEYEKACRGPIAPVPNEFAWGSATIVAAANISNSGQSNEFCNTAGANSVFNGNANVQGPMRVGVFAGASTTRQQSGASYYGVMELSGNLWERPVTVGNSTGRGFTGAHGDGALSANGRANAGNWPGLVSGEVTNASGVGYRGGTWEAITAVLPVSQRSAAAFLDSAADRNTGGRGVRTAP